MVNVLRLVSRAAFAYDLTSVTHKPIAGLEKGTSKPTGAISNFTASQAPNAPLQEAMVAYPYATTTRTGKLPKHSESDKITNAKDEEDACGYVEPYDPPPVMDQTSAPYDQTTANIYRYRQQQSVNLGSWFAHENWMTPSVFKCAASAKLSELDIANGWGSLENARATLERHWDTFITEDDFRYLASIGINTVRLPMGYWNLGPNFVGGTVFESVGEVYQNSWPRILRAINQAANHGIGVLVDMHGAVGSQNGQPHSGISDGQINLFNDDSNMEKTINALTYMAQNLAHINNVVGIQILNEPQAVAGLEDFYNRAISAMREKGDIPLYIHDGFDLDRFSAFVASRTDFIVQDHHSYFVFTPSDEQESGSQHTVDVNGAIADSLRTASNRQHRNLVVDEWSCALSPQSTVHEDDVVAVRKNFCHSQMKVYANNTAGWSFWSYKKEDCDSDPGWCFKAAVGNSLPSHFFLYEHGAQWKDAHQDGVVDDILPIISTVTDELSDILQPLNRDIVRPRLASRFESIQHRQDSDSGDDMTPSTSKGYNDGRTTARIFASNNMSRLGFSGQYIMDATRATNGHSLVAEGTQDEYKAGFMQGLREGENLAAG